MRRFIMLAFLLTLACLLCCTADSRTPTPRPYVSLAGLNSISGTVYDENHNGVPMAKVTLYYTKWSGFEYRAGDVVKVKDNPQYTSNGSLSPAGLYVYTNIPTDVYVLVVEKDGFKESRLIEVKGGTRTEDIVLEGYVQRSTPTPLPSASHQPSPLPDIAAGLSPLATLLSLFRLSLMCIVSVQLIVSLAILALFSSRR